MGFSIFHREYSSKEVAKVGKVLFFLFKFENICLLQKVHLGQLQAGYAHLLSLCMNYRKSAGSLRTSE